jgi:hypothetical protein
MTAPAVVQAARRSLGRVGAFLPESPADPTPAEIQRQACRRLTGSAAETARADNRLAGKAASR